MDEKIKEAVLKLVKKAEDESKADDALKFSQSALNLAHAGKVVTQ